MAKERTACDKLNIALAQIEAVASTLSGPQAAVLKAGADAARAAHIEIQTALQKLCMS